MNSIGLPTNIIAFRDLLRERFPEAHAFQPQPETPEPCEGSGLEILNLRKGAITEVVAEAPSSGAGVLITALLQWKGDSKELTALVDGSDAFDPWSLESAALERILWVRCREPRLAIRASDLLLRDGNIPLVILDLQAHPARLVQGLPSSVWHRLRMLAEKSGACLCAFTPVRAVACAHTRMRVRHHWALMDQYQERSALVSEMALQVERQRPRVIMPAPLKATA